MQPFHWSKTFRMLVGIFSCLPICILAQQEEPSYLLLGVSGTLQDGFELRDRLDYLDRDTPVPALFLGKALVRGYKAFLDVKNEGCREYKSGDMPQVPNAIVIPTGCYHHANIYWIYAVDTRQVLSILAGEPRFLSITPDTGLIDLRAAETEPTVRQLARREIRKLQKSNWTHVALPLVTGVWFQDTFVESPTIYVKDDGTNVTSYDGSLARWAGVEATDLTASIDEQECQVSEQGSSECAMVDAREEAWNAVYEAIRKAEQHPPQTAYPQQCQESVARFGVGPQHARINYPFTLNELLDFSEPDDDEEEED